MSNSLHLIAITLLDVDRLIFQEIQLSFNYFSTKQRGLNPASPLTAPATSLKKTTISTSFERFIYSSLTNTKLRVCFPLINDIKQQQLCSRMKL